jgi:hypothetical protein
LAICGGWDLAVSAENKAVERTNERASVLCVAALCLHKWECDTGSVCYYKSALALAIPRRNSSVKLVIAKSSLLSNKMVIASIKIGMKKEKKA